MSERLRELEIRRQGVLESIDAALTAKRYKNGNREKENQELSELRALLNDIDAELSAEERTPPLLGRTYQAAFQGR